MHKQQSKIVYNKNKTVMDKESTIAYQRAKAFKSKNPFIISFMQPSYVSIPYILQIHSEFARKYFLETDGNLVLRIPGSGSWSVKCTIRTGNAKVYSGWKAFVLENKLKVGDVCVFEVIKGSQLYVDVTIFRAAGSTLMHDIVAEVSGGSDSKSKVIKADNSVPCSQPRVVQIKKLRHQTGGSYGLNSKIKEELSEGTARHVQQAKSSCMGRVVAKEMVMAYQKAKTFTSKNPFLLSFMQTSYVSPARGPMQLSITSSVARKFFSTRQSDVVFQVSSKRQWTVKCTLGIANAKFSTGWKEFVLDNNLKVGDVCVFEWAGRPKLLFNVIIFPSTECI